jgi:hypothetical protein
VGDLEEKFANLRVKPGLRDGATQKLGGGWEATLGYSRAESLFVVWLRRPDGKIGTMRLPDEDVETRGRSQWKTDNTWRLSSRGLEHVLPFVRQVMGPSPMPNPRRRRHTTIQLAAGAGVEAFTMNDRGDDVPAKYIVTCERHNTFAGSRSLRDARVIATYPENFCEDCR